MGVAPMLHQIDVFKRVAYEPNPNGYYYWSSTYYYDRDDFSSLTNMWLRALNVDRIHTLDVVNYVKVVVKQPPGRNNVIATFPATSNYGYIPSAGMEFSPLIIGRLITLYDDGRSSYRMWRCPVLLDWLTDGAFNTYALARMGSYINNLRAVSGYPPSRNLTGSPCIGGVVPLQSSGWQLRHGTERRARIY